MRTRAPDFPSAGQDSRLRRWTLAFRAIFVLFIIWASGVTVLEAHAHSVHAGHSPLTLAALGTAEICGALLFLLRRTQLAGLAVLLAVFALAAGMSVLLGDNPLRFFYYAATAMFIHAVDRSTMMEVADGKR
jgi:hypothetical protein